MSDTDLHASRQAKSEPSGSRRAVLGLLAGCLGALLAGRFLGSPSGLSYLLVELAGGIRAGSGRRPAVKHQSKPGHSMFLEELNRYSLHGGVN